MIDTETTAADLLARLEGATADEQLKLLHEAIALAQRDGWISHTQATVAWRMIHVGAFESAALLLRPEGWSWQLYGPDPLASNNHPNGVGRPYCILGLPGQREADGRAVTPALAIVVAALRARAEQE